MTPVDAGVAGAPLPGASVPGAPVLALRAVGWSFSAPGGPMRVLEGVDLAVGQGEVVAVAGRSGSGKTTLLSIASGWVVPEVGAVELCGEPVGPERAWGEVALLPQSLGLLDELTIVENVTLPLRLGGGPPRAGEDVEPLLERLGVADLAGRYANEVSLGEQQRAALARAVVVRPRLLVADEPISHQNREWATAMVGLIQDLAVEGTACLLATHDELAIAAADRVLDLRDGRLQPRDA